MLFASHNPEKPGYPIEDAEAGAGGGESAVPLANLLAAADPAKGETVFAKCAACHTINSGGANGIGPNLFGRSEEHTSELQSLMRISYAVFCLKKKNATTKTHHI